MSLRKKCKQDRRLIPHLAVGTALFMTVSSPVGAEISEIDAFQRAVSTRSPEDALVFVRGFSSSHLIVDLLELLPPDVVLEVCSAAPASDSIAAPCAKLQAAFATAPAAGQPLPAQLPEDPPMVASVAKQPVVSVATPPQLAALPQTPDALGGEQQPAESVIDETLPPSSGGGNGPDGDSVTTVIIADRTSAIRSGSETGGASTTGTDGSSGGAAADGASGGSATSGGNDSASDGDPPDGAGDDVDHNDQNAGQAADGSSAGPKDDKADKPDKGDKGDKGGKGGKGKGPH